MVSLSPTRCRWRAAASSRCLIHDDHRTCHYTVSHSKSLVVLLGPRRNRVDRQIFGHAPVQRADSVSFLSASSRENAPVRYHVRRVARRRRSTASGLVLWTQSGSEGPQFCIAQCLFCILQRPRDFKRAVDEQLRDRTESPPPEREGAGG